MPLSPTVFETQAPARVFWVWGFLPPPVYVNWSLCNIPQCHVRDKMIRPYFRGKNELGLDLSLAVPVLLASSTVGWETLAALFRWPLPSCTRT